MKILIIGTPRSGTSSLLRGCNSLLKYNRYGEPWNLHIPDNDLLSADFQFEDNTIVKTLVHSPMQLYPEKNIHEFYKEQCEQFDRVIVLGRKNRKELLESYAFQMERGLKDKWQEPYELAETTHLNTDKYLNDINSYCDLLLVVSKNLGMNIVWYEDLYSGNIEVVKPIIDSWKLPLQADKLLPHLHPSKRFRRVSSIL
jgi:hypothetical protein